MEDILSQLNEEGSVAYLRSGNQTQWVAWEILPRDPLLDDLFPEGNETPLDPVPQIAHPVCASPDLTDTVTCGICHDVALRPVSTTCQHVYCHACWRSWSKTKANHVRVPCPMCKELQSREQVQPSRLLARIPVQCPLSHKCAWKGRMEDYDEHAIQRHYITDPDSLCACPACHQVMTANKWEETGHGERCLSRTVHCDACAEQVGYRYRLDHILVCAKRRVTCVLCHKVVSIGRFGSHLVECKQNPRP